MKTVELLESRLLSAHKTGSKTDRSLLENLYGKELFNKDITEHITTFQDVCDYAGVDINKYNLPTDATDEDRAAMAMRKMWLIIRVFRGDWKPDYSDVNQYKYYPWFKYNPGSGFVLHYVLFDYTRTVVGARLVLPNEKLVRHVAKHFIDIYNEFLTEEDC